MIKINNLVEEIFSTAVALDQSGGLKNTIYALKNSIFIMNYDHTVLLRFRLRKSESVFDSPVSFKANDYDSNIFEQVGDKIVFHTENELFSRKKTCGTSDMTPLEAKKLFKRYVLEDEVENRQKVRLQAGVFEFLDDALSHVEFVGKKGENLKLLQRNIYSGSVIEVEQKNEGLFGDKLEKSFKALGIKTGDLKALFNFHEVLDFYFPVSKDDNYIIVKSTGASSRNFMGVIACCLYDEIIEIRSAKGGE